MLLFLDIKLVTVKAYGGRRYTKEKELVLEFPQKTHGKFYLFVLYEATCGEVHWAYFAGKSSEYVIRLMKRVRGWYPEREVWIALDQDRAHPRKSKATKRAMRELKLHYVSLPKRSPDDNPVENVFSDVQMNILDNSHDANEKATQKRISAHLRGRNRRKDRKISIPYLDGINKH